MTAHQIPIFHRWIRLACVGTLFACAGIAAAAAADVWPSRPIRIVVPLPPGGPSDVILRPMAARMQARLGQAVIIDNKPGANGNLGAAEVARAAPDGYTWLWTTDTTLSINPHIYKNTGFKPGDLVPLNFAASFSQTLVCNPATGIKNVAEMVTRAKARTLTYASGGAGSPGHMLMEMLTAAARIQMTHVPYRGPAPAMQDLIGGQVDCGFLAGPTVQQSVKAGRLAALAVSGTSRSSLLPDVPTVAESGYADFDGTFWLVMLAPRNVPAEIQQRFLAALHEAVTDPAQKERANEAGMDMAGSTPAQALSRTDMLSARWQAVAQRIHLTVD